MTEDPGLPRLGLATLSKARRRSQSWTCFFCEETFDRFDARKYRMDGKDACLDCVLDRKFENFPDGTRTSDAKDRNA